MNNKILVVKSVSEILVFIAIFQSTTFNDPFGDFPWSGLNNKGIVKESVNIINSAVSFAKETVNTRGQNLVNAAKNMDAMGTLAKNAPEFTANIMIEGAKQAAVKKISSGGGLNNAVSEMTGEVIIGITTGMLTDKGLSKVRGLVRGTNAAKDLIGIFSVGDKFGIDESFIDGVDFLHGKADLGWCDGENAQFSIDIILKSHNSNGSIFESLTSKAEAIAKNAGLNQVRIDYNLVVNERLKVDPSWAREYGYNFSSTIDDFGDTNVTWSKIID